MAFYGTEGATIRIEPSGKVNVYVAGGSTGNSLETAVVQLTADALGVDIADVRTIQGDTAVTPFGAGTGGSRSGSMIAGAVEETAAVPARTDRRHRRAPPRSRARRHRARREPSTRPRHARASAISLAEIAEHRVLQADELPAGVPAGLEASGRYQRRSPMIWANATHVCTCEVDVVTGAVTLLRYIVSEDCGPMINPNVVEGQIAGGTVQGIGGVLFEHLVYDDDGNPLDHDLHGLPAPDRGRGADHRVRARRDAWRPGPAGTRASAKVAPSVRHRRSSTPIADALSPFGVEITRLPLTPAAIVELIDRVR